MQSNNPSIRSHQSINLQSPIRQSAIRNPQSAMVHPPFLFACLRTPDDPTDIFAIARDFSPRIQRHGERCVVFDVAGLGRLLGDAPKIGAELERAGAASGRAIHVAVAPTQTAALLFTLARPSLTSACGPRRGRVREPRGASEWGWGPTSVRVVTSDVATALADVPLESLRQLVQELGAGPRANAVASVQAELHARAFDVLARWGLKTLGELAALPAADLSARLGQHGIALQRLACGMDLWPLVPDPDVPRFIERMELEWPIDALEPLSFVLARMLDPLSSALERADRGAAAIRLDLRLVDRTTFARMLQLPAAMRDARVLRTLLLLGLESHPPPAAIDIVTLEIDPAPGRVIQYSLLERAVPSVETIATLTARLGALVGESRCGSPTLLDTHRPDGFEMRRFDLTRAASATALEARGTRHHFSALAGPHPRSLRLDSLRSLAAAAGAAPNTTHVAPGAEHLAPVLRRFRPPVAIRVTLENGRPVRVAIDRRGMPGGHVMQLAGPWRTSGAWWDPASTEWNRDEWDVALNDGSLCRLFRDRQSSVWFMEGILD
jgi:protein ImuB